MGEHPIENLMDTAMNSIKDMIDVNTIVGEPIQASNNTVIIPISKVGFGFAAGGSEFKGETIDEYKKRDKEEDVQYRLPFGGGAGAGVSIAPIAFLVVQSNGVKLLPVNHSSCWDKLFDYVPDLIEKVNTMLNKQMQNKKEEKEQEIKRIDKKERELQEKCDKIKQEKNQRIEKNERTISEDINNISTPVVRPKKNKPHKQVETYEFEYDENDGEEDLDTYYENDDNQY